MKMIEHAAEIYYYNNSISEKREEITFICNDGKCSSGERILELEGNVPQLGTIKIDKNGKVTLNSIIMNGYSCSKKNNGYKCVKTNKRISEFNKYIATIKDNKSTTITNYKIYGNSEQEILPKNYQQVDYIRYNGQAYIDTGVAPTSQTRVVYNFSVNFSTNAYKIPLGVYNDKKYFAAGIDNTNFFVYRYGDNKFNFTSKEANYHTKYKIELSKNGFYVDDELLAQVSTTIDSSTSNIYVGAINMNDSPLFAYSTGKINIYDLKIYEDNQLIRNMIPCYRKNDNVTGMYDLVEDKFYSNLGTTQFTLGDKVQNSTNPVEIKNVGDLITDTHNDNYGKYEIKIKVNRKNIVNVDNISDKIGDIHFKSRFNFNKFSYPTGYYTLSAYMQNEYEGDYSRLGIYEYDEEGNRIKGLGYLEHTSITNNRESKTFYLEQGKIYKINTTYGASSSNYNGKINIENIQLEFGKEVTEYEPYKEEIYSIYLDEPLRCVKDTCDYIDFNEKKIVRKIRKYVFTGKESWGGGDIGKLEWGGTNTVGFYQYINTNGGNIFGKYYPSEKGLSINNYFINLNNGLYNQDVEGEKTMKNTYYSMRINRSVLEEYGSDNSSVSLNQTAFASFLKDKYEKGNPVYVLYELEKEIEEEISLPEIYLNEGISNIMIDTKIKPTKIELEYYK